MASSDEIVERIDRRLEELFEESTRAFVRRSRRSAAMIRRGSRRLHAGRTARPVVKTLGRGGPVKPSGCSAAAVAEPNALDGDDATQDAAVERANRQLRQELAVGLRG